MQGDDFNNDPKEVGRLALSGGVGTVSMLIGPAQILKVFKYGEEAAELAGAAVFAELGPAGKGILKESAQAVAKKEIAGAGREAFVAGKNITKEQIDKITEKIAKDGATDVEKEQIRQALRQQITEKIKEQGKLAAREGMTSVAGTAEAAPGAVGHQAEKSALSRQIGDHARRLAREVPLNAAAGGTASALGTMVETPLDYDTNQSVGKNLERIVGQFKDSVVGGAVGAAGFTVVMHVGMLGLHVFKGANGEAKIAKSNPSDVVVQHANGSKEVVSAGTEKKLAADDRVVSVNEPHASAEGVDRLVNGDKPPQQLHPPAQDHIAVDTSGAHDLRRDAHTATAKTETVEIPGGHMTVHELTPEQAVATNRP